MKSSLGPILIETGWWGGEDSSKHKVLASCKQEDLDSRTSIQSAEPMFKKKKEAGNGNVSALVISTLGRQRQADPCSSLVNLVQSVSFRLRDAISNTHH